MLKICYRRFSGLSSNCSGLFHHNLPVMFALFGVIKQEDLGVAYLSVCLGVAIKFDRAASWDQRGNRNLLCHSLMEPSIDESYSNVAATSKFGINWLLSIFCFYYEKFQRHNIGNIYNVIVLN